QFQVGGSRPAQRPSGNCDDRSGWFDLSLLTVGPVASGHSVCSPWAAFARPNLAGPALAGKTIRLKFHCLKPSPSGRGFEGRSDLKPSRLETTWIRAIHEVTRRRTNKPLTFVCLRGSALASQGNLSK